MALSTLDRNSALVIIDLQKGIASLSLAHPVPEVVANAAALAAAFRCQHLPVVLVNVAGAARGRTGQPPALSHDLPADWTNLLPELGQDPRDLLVTKHTRGAFTNTALEASLKDQGVTEVVLAGIATSGGVETTAMQAYELGFNVALATDAMTDRDLESHTRCLTRNFPRLGECGTTQEILALLESTRP